MRETRSNHPGSARGFALLVTLVMLALLAVILGGLARRSADVALQANESERALRQRWAELSSGHTLLVTASWRAEERLLAWLALQDREASGLDQARRPQGSEFVHLELAGLDIWGRIDDEQSKINLNQRLASSPDASVSPQMVADEVLSPIRASGLNLTRAPFAQALGLHQIMSWAQVLPRHQPLELLGIQAPEQLVVRQNHNAVTDRVTLWGDGRLNIWTTDSQTLRRGLTDPTVTQSVDPETVEELLYLRDNEPTLSLGTLINNATADREGDRSLLNDVLTERSKCFALWLAVRSNKHDNTRIHWSLMVIETGDDSATSSLKQYRW